jgi:hypothetical protein
MKTPQKNQRQCHNEQCVCDFGVFYFSDATLSFEISSKISCLVLCFSLSFFFLLFSCMSFLGDSLRPHTIGGTIGD